METTRRFLELGMPPLFASVRAQLATVGKHCPRCSEWTSRRRTPLVLQPLRLLLGEGASYRRCRSCGWQGMARDADSVWREAARREAEARLAAFRTEFQDVDLDALLRGLESYTERHPILKPIWRADLEALDRLREGERKRSAREGREGSPRAA